MTQSSKNYRCIIVEVKLNYCNKQFKTNLSSK